MPYLLIELFDIGMPVVRTDGLSGGRSVYGHVITKFSRMGRLLHFLTLGAPLARFARESSATNLLARATRQSLSVVCLWVFSIVRLLNLVCVVSDKSVVGNESK